MNPAGHYGMKNVLDRNFYDETIRIDYDTITVNVPKNYNDYLKHYYNDWTAIPDSGDCKEGLEFKVKISDNVDLSFLN